MNDGKARGIGNVNLRKGQPRRMDTHGFAARELFAKQVCHTLQCCPAPRAAQFLPEDGGLEQGSPPQRGRQRGTRQKSVHIPIVDDGKRAVGKRLDADPSLGIRQQVVMQVAKITRMLERKDDAFTILAPFVGTRRSGEQRLHLSAALGFPNDVGARGDADATLCGLEHDFQIVSLQAKALQPPAKWRIPTHVHGAPPKGETTHGMYETLHNQRKQRTLRRMRQARQAVLNVRLIGNNLHDCANAKPWTLSSDATRQTSFIFGFTGGGDRGANDKKHVKRGPHFRSTIPVL